MPGSEFREGVVSDDWPASMVLDGGAVLVVSTITNAQGELLPDEASLLLSARPARRREIIAGRVMARHAMSMLGVTVGPILMDRQGAPCWPAGLCGSIAHSAHHIAAVVSRTRDQQSMGIDIEDGRDLGRATQTVASESDIESILALGLVRHSDEAARLVFSAKEALYKCQAPVTGNTRLDFPEIALCRRPDGMIGAQVLGVGEANYASRLSAVAIYFKQIQGVKVAIAAMY